jgi:hypothetical protein
MEVVLHLEIAHKVQFLVEIPMDQFPEVPADHARASVRSGSERSF